MSTKPVNPPQVVAQHLPALHLHRWTSKVTTPWDRCGVAQNIGAESAAHRHFYHFGPFIHAQFPIDPKGS